MTPRLAGKAIIFFVFDDVIVGETHALVVIPPLATVALNPMDVSFVGKGAPGGGARPVILLGGLGRRRGGGGHVFGSVLFI